jgi:hypothetical protein
MLAHTRRLPRGAALAATALTPIIAPPIALAGDIEGFRFGVRSASSSVTTDLSAGASLLGTLIGDYDAKTNPAGTRTIPGLFGSTSGNHPIDFSGTAGFIGSDTTHPSGMFDLSLDLETGLATISGLHLDLTNGRSIGVTLGFTIEYESFRTRQPTAVFIGGIPIPIPFGQVNLTALTLSQTGLSGAGVAQQTGPGRYTVTLIAPVELVANIETPGDPVQVGSIVVPLPLVLDVTVEGNAASASFAFDQSFVQQFPLELDLPADQPLDLPTILPPGETAHLLLNAALESFDVDFTLGAMLEAAGERIVYSRADWNRDTEVDSQDYFAFLVDFFVGGADFNSDGASNSQDYFDFLAVYFADR